MAFFAASPCPRLLGALLAAAVFALIGCGSGLPKVYPVKGKVVHKGKGPATELAGYNVQLQSVNASDELPGGGIEENGSFTLYTRVGGKVIPGVKEGTYRACLLPPPAEGGPPPRLLIPVRYTKFDTSKLEYTITPNEHEITIEIER